MDLLSSSQKSVVNAVLDDLHDTFKRLIYVFRAEKEALVATDSQYNGIYKKTVQQNGKPKYVMSEVYARIRYYDKGQASAPQLESQNGVYIAAGTVRLKLDQDGFDALHGAERVEVDGQSYKIMATPNVAGPFGINHYVIYLQKADA